MCITGEYFKPPKTDTVLTFKLFEVLSGSDNKSYKLIGVSGYGDDVFSPGETCIDKNNENLPYYGFHAFFDLNSAKAAMDIYRAWRIAAHQSDDVEFGIFKIRLEEISAEGELHLVNIKFKCIAGHKMTILEKVE